MRETYGTLSRGKLENKLVIHAAHIVHVTHIVHFVNSTHASCMQHMRRYIHTYIHASHSAPPRPALITIKILSPA